MVTEAPPAAPVKEWGPYSVSIGAVPGCGNPPAVVGEEGRRREWSRTAAVQQVPWPVAWPRPMPLIVNRVLLTNAIFYYLTAGNTPKQARQELRTFPTSTPRRLKAGVVTRKAKCMLITCSSTSGNGVGRRAGTAGGRKRRRGRIRGAPRPSLRAPPKQVRAREMECGCSTTMGVALHDRCPCTHLRTTLTAQGTCWQASKRCGKRLTIWRQSCGTRPPRVRRGGAAGPGHLGSTAAIPIAGCAAMHSRADGKPRVLALSKGLQSLTAASRGHPAKAAPYVNRRCRARSSSMRRRPDPLLPPPPGELCARRSRRLRERSRQLSDYALEHVLQVGRRAVADNQQAGCLIAFVAVSLPWARAGGGVCTGGGMGVGGRGDLGATAPALGPRQPTVGTALAAAAPLELPPFCRAGR
jgi:hypothetical protein